MSVRPPVARRPAARSHVSGAARAPRPAPSASPHAAAVTPAAPDLTAAAQAAGADVRSGPGFMEISFPPPAGAAPATVARQPAGPSPSAPPPANPARSLGGGAVLARAVSGGAGGSPGSSSTDDVVNAVLRAMREENEHLGILDGIDPLF